MRAAEPGSDAFQQAAPPGASGTCTSAAELREQRDVCAALLAPGGLSAGDTVALLATTSPDVLALLLTTRDLGLRLLPLDATYSIEELAYAVNGCGAVALVATREFAGAARALEPMTPQVKLRCVLGEAAGRVARPTARAGSVGTAYCSAVGTGRPAAYPVPDPIDDPAGQRDLVTLLGGVSLARDAVLVTATSLADPVSTQLVTAVLLSGGRVACPAGDNVDDAIESAVCYGATLLHLTPRQVVQLAKRGADRIGDLRDRHLRLLLVSVPGCPVDILRGLGLGAIVGVFRQVYIGPGAGALCAISGDEMLERPRSVGRPAAGLVRISPGGLVQVADPRAPERWRSWGDHGHLDPDGYLHLADRDSFLESGGAFVVPREIEAELIAHPMVADAAVSEIVEAGVHRIAAYIEPEPGVNVTGATEEELLDWLRPRVPASWVPHRVEFLSAMPRTASGKLDRRRLRRHDSLSLGEIA